MKEKTGIEGLVKEAKNEVKTWDGFVEEAKSIWTRYLDDEARDSVREWLDDKIGLPTSFNPKYDLETTKDGEYVLVKLPDESPYDPREDSTLGIIYSAIRSYNPDGHKVDELEELYRLKLRNSQEDIGILESNRNIISYPVYAYIHSGIALSLGQFSDPWDSGLFGFYIVDKAKIREEWGKKRITKDVRKRIDECVESEIQQLDDYYNGNVYGVCVLERDGDSWKYLDDDEVCWGFFGEDEAKVEGAGRVKCHEDQLKEKEARHCGRGVAQKYGKKGKQSDIQMQTRCQGG